MGNHILNEMVHRDGSLEYLKHMFKLLDKKVFTIFTKNAYLNLCKHDKIILTTRQEISLWCSRPGMAQSSLTMLKFCLKQV